MSSRTSALIVAQRAGRLRGLRRSAGCRRCESVALHSTTASSPSRNSSSMVNGTRLRLQRPAPARAAPPVLEPPSLAPTNAELAEQLGVEVAGHDDALGPRARQRGDDVDHRAPVRAACWPSNGCSTAVMPAAASWSMMYWRVARWPACPRRAARSPPGCAGAPRPAWLSNALAGAGRLAVAAAQRPGGERGRADSRKARPGPSPQPRLSRPLRPSAR